MAINIKSPEAVIQIRRLARLRNTDLTQAVLIAVNHELERETELRKNRLHRMRSISNRAVALPLLDKRSSDEILGYDASGLPQ